MAESISVKFQPRTTTTPSVGTILLKTGSEDICDDVYSDGANVLVQIINCVGVKPNGSSLQLSQKYPYSNTYIKRKPMSPRMNLAVKEDRGVPGKIEVNFPPDCQYGNSLQACVSSTDKPIIVNLLAKYYHGQSYEKNYFAQRMVDRIENHKLFALVDSVEGISFEDDDLLHDNILKDTACMRLTWFSECLNELTTFLESNCKFVKCVIFPYPIECEYEGVDSSEYLSAIIKFGLCISKAGISLEIIHTYE